MRGSDPDATVFYLARALNGGEDPMFLARRIVIAAAEEVGLANPMALQLATSAMHLAQELLMNIQCGGSLRSFTKEMRALRMRSVVAGHQKLTTAS